MKTVFQLVASSVIGLALVGIVLFLPAGTLNFWNAWVFIAVYVATTAIGTIYLAVTNPQALRRRMRAGPTAETRPVQKVVALAVCIWAPAIVLVSALDHRYEWSSVPTLVSLGGNVLVAVGLGITMLVPIQNSYAAATITVEAGQKVVSTGLYGLVRHPMYAGALIMMAGIPLALDSHWGLLLVVLVPVLYAVRIFDEEKALREELAGYHEYTQDVPYRLVPYVW